MPRWERHSKAFRLFIGHFIYSQLLKLAAALIANTLIFGAATRGSEIFVENQKNKPKPNHIKRLFSLAAVIAVMKVPLVIMTGIAGTAHEFQPTDSTLNAQIEARTQFERANTKTEYSGFQNYRL